MKLLFLLLFFYLQIVTFGLESMGFSWAKNSVVSASSTHRIVSLFSKKLIEFD